MVIKRIVYIGIIILLLLLMKQMQTLQLISGINSVGTEKSMLRVVDMFITKR